MSITDELRAWAKGSTLSSWTAEHLTAIADRIDAEHESACAEAYGNGVMSVPISLDESAWVELPKDADGEYIHIGDVMEGEKIGGGYGEPFEVVGYVMRNGELEPMDEHRNPRKRKYSHHHHAQTVEDVLRELVAAYMDTPLDDSNDGEFFAEYAAKLRLADDAK